MFNVIYNRPRSIKRIENELFGGLDIIMTSDFYQASLVKKIGFFKMSRIMLIH
jgi:hypothetical protein